MSEAVDCAHMLRNTSHILQENRKKSTGPGLGSEFHLEFEVSEDAVQPVSQSGHLAEDSPHLLQHKKLPDDLFASIGACMKQ